MTRKHAYWQGILLGLAAVCLIATLIQQFRGGHPATLLLIGTFFMCLSTGIMFRDFLKDQKQIQEQGKVQRQKQNQTDAPPADHSERAKP